MFLNFLFHKSYFMFIMGNTIIKVIDLSLNKLEISSSPEQLSTLAGLTLYP